jgi:hypothetical protein
MYGFENVEVLMGKVLTKIEKINDDELFFHTTDGDVYKMYHYQDCCEWVRIEEIIGDIDDLIGSPITMAEEITEESDEGYDHQTWTFYKFATNKGYVTLRWLGESNGYYSESVDFKKLDKEELS